MCVADDADILQVQPQADDDHGQQATQQPGPGVRSGTPSCACEPGYYGEPPLAWSRQQGRWEGACVEITCPVITFSELQAAGLVTRQDCGGRSGVRTCEFSCADAGSGGAP